jgi:anaerobic magnesium-protoporphyrin IX monomethyl ester cyclase
MLNQMHKNGLRKIHFGIESGTQRILNDVYNKKINIKDMENTVRLAKKIGIHMLGFFMIGAPGETAEEINSTIALADKLPLDEATFSITTPFAGTSLYEKIKQSPDYEISKEYEDFDYYRKTPIKKGGISTIKLRYLQINALFMFYTHPARLRYILRHLFNLRGIKRLYRKLKRFV